MHNRLSGIRHQWPAPKCASTAAATVFAWSKLIRPVYLCIFVCCLAGILFTQADIARAGPRGGMFSQPFSRYANQDPLQAVLLDFAQTQGYRAVVAPGVEGVISGRFDAVPPGTFLDGLRAAFGVSWYTLGNTIYFYPEAQSTRMFISPRATQPEVMFEALRSSGVLSPELSAELAPGGQMIIVYGPPNYLNEVRDAVAAFEETRTANVVMRVFPLKYAWADDITLTSMDNTVTVPGVASILRAMITGQSASTTRVSQNAAQMDNLLGSGLAAQGSEVIPTAPQAETAPGAQVGGVYVNVMADPRVNAILVTDAEYRMAYYEQVIADLDRPVELVEIHAAIVDIDVDYSRELGVDYQGSGMGTHWGGGGSLSSDGANYIPNPPAGVLPGPGLNISTIYTAGADYFIARVHALEEEGDARVLGRPSVLTVDNVQATLENTSTYYIKVEGYQSVDLFKVEAGTVLKVMPHIIRREGMPDSIKLAVTVQDNQDSQDETTPVGVVPPIKQTKINTQAIIGEGQSLLIGGYYFEESRDDESGIPVLMSIPVLGQLFKTDSSKTRRMERLIMITPRIIRLDEVPTVPERVDNKSFHMAPGQPDYEYRTPEEKPHRGGCGRRAPAPDSETQPTSTGT